MLKIADCLRNSVSIPRACRERFLPLAHPAAAAWRLAGATLCGISDLITGYRIGASAPRDIMLIATVAGRGEAVTPAGRVELAPGSSTKRPF